MVGGLNGFESMMCSFLSKKYVGQASLPGQNRFRVCGEKSITRKHAGETPVSLLEIRVSVTTDRWARDAPVA